MITRKKMKYKTCRWLGDDSKQSRKEYRSSQTRTNPGFCEWPFTWFQHSERRWSDVSWFSKRVGQVHSECSRLIAFCPLVRAGAWTSATYTSKAALPAA